MKKVKRDEIIDYQTYSEQRDEIRAQAMAQKNRRRIHAGELTFLFENPLTVRYQVQEMMRAEQLVKEAEIKHELETYNELLGDDGELGATLLIEIEDEATRAQRLTGLLELPDKCFVELTDGQKVFATFDQRQKGEDRVSSVQFLKFDTGGEVPVAVGAEHPELTQRTELTPDQQQALREDLSS